MADFVGSWLFTCISSFVGEIPFFAYYIRPFIFSHKEPAEVPFNDELHAILDYFISWVESSIINKSAVWLN